MRHAQGVLVCGPAFKTAELRTAAATRIQAAWHARIAGRHAADAAAAAAASAAAALSLANAAAAAQRARAAAEQLAQAAAEQQAAAQQARAAAAQLAQAAIGQREAAQQARAAAAERIQAAWRAGCARMRRRAQRRVAAAVLIQVAKHQVQAILRFLRCRSGRLCKSATWGWHMVVHTCAPYETVSDFFVTIW